MDEYRNLIIFSCVMAYMALCIGVGLWAMRRTRSTRDFFMAGRHLGVFVTALAVFSSTLSGFGFVGGPGLVELMGMSSVWMVICSSIGFCVSFYLLGKRLRLFAEVRDSISLPDAVAARYKSEMSRFLTAVAIVVGVIGYLGSQIKAMATVLKDILDNVEWLGEVSVGLCAVISVAVLVFYCVTGGIVASVYTDMIQGAIMVVAALLVFFTTLTVVDGGMSGIATTIMQDDPEAISPWGTLGVMGCLSWYFLFGLGGAGQPHIITKMMMTRRLGDVRHIFPISVAGYSVAALLWISIGLAMRALVIQGVHGELENPDQAASQFLQFYTNPLLAGVVFAGLFAAIMSTADGFLNIGSAAIVHDIPKSIGGYTIKNELLWARIVTVLIALASLGFAYTVGDDLVALLGATGWALFAAALVPAVAIGFNWKRATATAANVAIAVSVPLILLFKVAGWTLPFGIDVGAAALALSLTLFFGISLASKPPEIDKDIDALMDL